MQPTISDTGEQPDPTIPDMPPPAGDVGTSRRVLGGVAALVARQLGVSPFFLRLSFVALALAGGVGVVLYIGLWLLLVVGADHSRSTVRLLGGAISILGPMYLLASHLTGLLRGTTAVIALLLGLTLTLWQPRTSVATPPPSAPSAAATVDAQRQRAPRRPRSVLGQAVLGLAVVTAAVGALIDQANGGRLHPEQWLGVAAAVCGAGLLVGTFYGRGRWLIVPAAVLAATAYVGGAAAERGISLQDRGDRYSGINPSRNGSDERLTTSHGTVYLGIYSIPDTPVHREIAVLVGDVNIDIGGDVDPSIDLRWDVDHGSVTTEGVDQRQRATLHIGPNRPADVVIDVAVWRGDIAIHKQLPTTEVDPNGSADGSALDPSAPATTIASTSDTVLVTDGVTLTADGSFVLGNEEATIDADDHLVFGQASIRADGVTDITTSYGRYELLPRGILLTPVNEVIDLHAVRAQSSANGASPTTSGAVPTTVAAPIVSSVETPTTSTMPASSDPAATTTLPTTTTIGQG